MSEVQSTQEAGPLVRAIIAIHESSPLVLLQKAIVSRTAQKKPDPAIEEAKRAEAETAAAQAEHARMLQEMPWKGTAEYSEVVTGQQEEPRMMSFHHLGEGLIGKSSRAGVYGDTLKDRLALNGIGGISRQGQTAEVFPPKAESVPTGLPFNSQRKSGENFWGDEPKRSRRTQIF